MAEEAGEIWASEETEEADIGAAEGSEEIGVAEAAGQAEGHGVVKETPTTRQTHTAHRAGAKRAIPLQIKPGGDKAQRHIPQQTQMHHRPGEGQAPTPWE